MRSGRSLIGSIPFIYITGIGVPVLLAILGVLGKKLARGKGWKRQDFYLGPEFTLAAVSAALLNIFDLLNPSRATPGNPGILLSNVIVAFLGVVLFMFVVSLHQDWESNGDVIANGNPGKSVKRELFWLLGICNMIGFGLLLAGIIAMPEG
jgi:hypothetical protein